MVGAQDHILNSCLVSFRSTRKLALVSILLKDTKTLTVEGFKLSVQWSGVLHVSLDHTCPFLGLWSGYGTSLVELSLTVFGVCIGVCRNPWYRSATGCWLMKTSQKQADFTVFALDPSCARAPFTPPGYAGSIKANNIIEIHYQEEHDYFIFGYKIHQHMWYSYSGLKQLLCQIFFFFQNVNLVSEVPGRNGLFINIIKMFCQMKHRLSLLFLIYFWFIHFIRGINLVY